MSTILTREFDEFHFMCVALLSPNCRDAFLRLSQLPSLRDWRFYSAILLAETQECVSTTFRRTHVNKDWWRQQCGVVMQEGVIFSESIARNIAVDDSEVDKERLAQAARIACIHDYVMSLPLKYNTKIGRDGVGLSLGQKRRVLIARAVYKDPDYIFLDEATNSLDANNERAIVENLAKFYQGKTVVVVAHRLSTVRDADQIIVLHQGKVVETGNHETLIARKGAYYDLVKILARYRLC